MRLLLVVVAGASNVVLRQITVANVRLLRVQRPVKLFQVGRLINCSDGPIMALACPESSLAVHRTVAIIVFVF